MTGATSRVKLGALPDAADSSALRVVASAASGTASARSAAAATAKRLPLRMLGVVCTPELPEHATDLADRAVRAERLAHGMEEVAVARCRASDLCERVL